MAHKRDKTCRTLNKHAILVLKQQNMPLCIMSPLPLGPLFLQWCNGIWLKTIVTSVDYHEEGAPNICTKVVNENAHNFTECMKVLSTFAIHFNDGHLVITAMYFQIIFFFILRSHFLEHLVYICKYDNQLHTLFLGGVFSPCFCRIF